VKYIIITGASRGLGEAITRKLISPNNCLLCISRKKNNELLTIAKNNNTNLDYFEYDLNCLEGIDALVDNIFSKIDKCSIESICLINNAGLISPIKRIEKCKSNEIINSFNVNLIAPILLTSLFMRYTRDFNIEKRVINISSGAAKKPYYGWSCYCGSKSGLDLFTKCVRSEQENKEYPVKIISFIPGVMDTNMQEEIRTSQSEDFIQIERFIAFKEEGKLLSPDFVSERIVELLNSEDFGKSDVIDIKDYL